jgi:hypothetical protein
LESALEQYQLTTLQREMAVELALHEEGLPYGDAVASIAGPDLDCHQSLMRLQQLGIASIRDTTGYIRLEFEKLGLDAEGIAGLVIANEAFDSLGSPLSPKATQALAALFDAPGTLYLAVESAGRDAFAGFEARARASRSTVFIYPPESSVPPARLDTYKSALRDWQDWFDYDPRQRRKTTQILISHTQQPQLYMSALTSARLHYTIWTVDADVRHGQRIEVGRGTSLYKTIDMEFRLAVLRARPLFKLWPWRWIRAWTRPYAGAVLGVAVAGGLSLIGGGVLLFIAAVVGSVAANAIWEALKARHFEPPALFEN